MDGPVSRLVMELARSRGVAPEIIMLSYGITYEQMAWDGQTSLSKDTR